MSEKKDERIPIEEVLEDMCFHEVGFIRDAAEAYYRTNYLHERKEKNKERKPWEFWKPRYIWRKT